MWLDDSPVQPPLAHAWLAAHHQPNLLLGSSSQITLTGMAPRNLTSILACRNQIGATIPGRFLIQDFSPPRGERDELPLWDRMQSPAPPHRFACPRSEENVRFSPTIASCTINRGAESEGKKGFVDMNKTHKTNI